MRKLFGLAAISALFAFAAPPETYSGRLLDAHCVMQKTPSTSAKSSACDPTSNSTTFALNVSGKMYRLDDAGNAKVIEAMKSRADREKDPSMPASTMVNAKATGTLEGDVLQVDTIQVQ